MAYDVSETIVQVPTALIFGNPKQPRRTFDPGELEDLAASIRENGQQQPTIVTDRPGHQLGDWMIVMGERRWRAQCLNRAETMPCVIRPGMTDAEVLIYAIVENRQRVDVPPLEEAQAFQAALDSGMTEQELAEKVGLQQAFRIRERTCLLQLRDEYQKLLSKGQLTPTQAWEMAQLSPNGQDALFKAIRRGECPTASLLRSTALVLRDAESQADIFGPGDEPPPPTASEKALAKGLERRVNQVAAMLRAAIIENEVVAAKKVDPTRAGTIADTIAAMQIDLQRIERSLR